MTIGIILDDTLDKNDGVQNAVIVVARQLRLKGHSVHFIVPHSSRTDIPNVHSVGRFISLKFNGNSIRTPLPVSSKKIKKIFSEVKFDVLHIQMPYSPFFGAKVLKLAPEGTLKFGTFHILPYNFLAKMGTKLVGFFMRRSLSSLDKCYAVSKPAQRFLKDSFNIQSSILANPIDYSFFSNYKKQQSTLKEIVFVGRFDKRKGVIQMIEAYKNLEKDNRLSTRLVMCGKGPLLTKAKALNGKHSLNIEFPGYITDEQKAQYLANADIAVFPSISGESFGIVLAEAMASRAGVTLGGNNPGYASVLEDWPETLFNPTDIKMFTNQLQKFIADDSLRSKIGKLQHEAVKQYDVKQIVDRLIDDYTG